MLPKGVLSALEVSGVVMPVTLRQHLGRHPKEASGLPYVDSRLHQPSGSGVPEDMRSHLSAKARVGRRVRKGSSDVPDALAIPLNCKPLPAPFPAPQMRQNIAHLRHSAG